MRSEASVGGDFGKIKSERVKIREMREKRETYKREKRESKPKDMGERGPYKMF